MPRRRAAARDEKIERRQTVIYLSPSSIRELKLLAIEQERAMVDLIREAIEQYLKKRGRPTQA
jgi:hypothetical protein